MTDEKLMKVVVFEFCASSFALVRFDLINFLGSHTMELAMKLIQLMISKLPAEKFYVEHPSELSKMVSFHVLKFFSFCVNYDTI